MLRHSEGDSKVAKGLGLCDPSPSLAVLHAVVLLALTRRCYRGSLAERTTGEAHGDNLSAMQAPCFLCVQDGELRMIELSASIA